MSEEKVKRKLILSLAVLLVETFGELTEQDGWEDVVSNDSYVDARLQDKYGEEAMSKYKSLTPLEWSQAFREFDKALGVR